MFEPVIQDYMTAFTELDRETFCEKIGVPVLISKVDKHGIAFQDAATRMVSLEKPENQAEELEQLSHLHTVIELRKTGDEDDTQISIGRVEENDVVINDETVSSQHAVLFADVRSGQTMLQDLDSTNGTTLNGTLLRPGRAVEINDGDTIAFGETLYLFFTPGGLYDEIAKLVPKPS